MGVQAFELVDNSAQASDIQAAKAQEKLSSSAIDLFFDWLFPKKTEAENQTQLPKVELTNKNACRLGPHANNPNLAMGNPSDASEDPSNRNNYLHVKDQYAMSYSSDNKTPNWVSWQLNKSWMGSVKRTGNFNPDFSLPATLEKSTPADYKNSGYDRGHNVPSGDRTRSRADNESTFLMSNITPQSSDNNQGPWEKLESYSRELAKEGKDLYIIAGSDGSKGRIGDGVNVPETFWKVIVVLPKEGMGVNGVNQNTDVIAVEMPNVNGIRYDDWRKYLTTVSSIEKNTGYDLLSCLPDDIENAVSQKKYQSPRGN